MLKIDSPGDEQRLLVLRAIVAERAGFAFHRPDEISVWRWDAMVKHLRREWAELTGQGNEQRQRA